jgi:hypothetical protein
VSGDSCIIAFGTLFILTTHYEETATRCGIGLHLCTLNLHRMALLIDVATGTVWQTTAYPVEVIE